MSIISRLINSGDLLLYHDYRSGSFRDFSGNSKHGTPTVTKLNRTGANFSSSTGSKITAGSDNIGTGAKSIFFFANLYGPGEAGSNRFFDNGEVVLLENVANNRLQYTLDNFGSGTKSTAVGTFFAGVVNFVVVTWDSSGNVDVWINGTAIDTGVAAGTPSAGSTMVIGNGVSLARQINGNIATLGAVNRELTASEVQELEAEVRSKKWNQQTIFRSSIGSGGLPLDDNVIASYSLPGVTDLTGNGYNGTLVGSPRKAKSSIGDNYHFLGSSSNYITLPTSAWPGTTGAFEFVTQLDSGTDNGRIFGVEATGSEDLRTFSNIDGRLYFYATNGSGTVTPNTLTDFAWGRPNHVVCEWEYDGSTNTTYRLFVNGSLVDSDTLAGTQTTPDIGIQLAEWRGLSFDGYINCAAIHNTTRTAAQWTARMNQFFQKEATGLGPGALETVSNVTAGPLPGTPFEVNSGTFKTTYDTINGEPVKVIECVADGVIYAPWSRLQNNETEAAYGTWEWWAENLDASIDTYIFCASFVGNYNNANQDGYLFSASATEAVRLYEVSSGSLSLLFLSAIDKAPDGVLNKYKVTRSPSGSFSVYVNDELLAADSGSNPVTDTTHTSTKYFVWQARDGEKMAIAAFGGTPLFVKRKGVA